MATPEPQTDPPTFEEVLRRRRMVRRYRPDPVDPEVVDAILDAARRGPSAGFSQPQRFVVITDAAARRRVASACGEEAAVARGLPRWLSEAPVHVLPCIRLRSYAERYAEPDKAGGSTAPGAAIAHLDGGAAVMLLLLTAVARDLAAGFLSVEESAIRGVLDFPADWTPLGLVTIGHAADDGRPGSQTRPRLPLEQLVHRADG